MTSLTSDPPCWVDALRAGTNDARDFMETMLWLLENGALPAGSILVMDNARIHDAASIRGVLASRPLWERVQQLFTQVPRALVSKYYEHVILTPHTLF